MIAVFKENRFFLPFWLARVVSQIGDGIHALAVLWFSYHTTNSPKIVGLVMIAVSLPGILVSPFAGNLADRINRKIIMAFADFFRFFAVGFLAFVSAKGFLNIPILILVSVLISIASAFFDPSAMALLPQIVKKDDLTSANAFSQISANVSLILGPLIGMTLISGIGISFAFGLNSLSFLFSGFLILRVKATMSEHLPERTNVIKAVKEGFVLLKKYPLVFKMLDKIAIINFFFSSITIVIPVIAENIYHKGASGIGIMMSFYGGGMLVSSLLLSFKKVKGSPKLKLTLALFFMGTFIAIFGTVYRIEITYLSLFMVGFCLNFTNVNLISIYQTVLPNEILGRIMAFLTAIALSLQPLSYGITGWAVDLMGMKPFMLVSGVLIMFSALRVWFVRELGGNYESDIIV